MQKILAILHTVRWAMWAVLGVGVAVVIWLIRHLFDGPKQPDGPTALPPVPPALQAKVDKVQEEAMKARVEATVKTEESQKEMAEIAKIPDGAERRKRLAEKLRNL